LSLIACKQKVRTLEVSLINLLITPKDISGNMVQVKGFLKNTPFGIALFASEDDARINNTSVSIIIVDLKENNVKNCLNTYVWVEAKFELIKAIEGYGLSQTEQVIKLQKDGYLGDDCWLSDVFKNTNYYKSMQLESK
jgi:hypothetical protein